MPDEPTTPEVKRPKKIHRVQIGLNVLVQIALVLFLAAAANYLGFEHYKRWDLSRDKKYTLSDKTRRFLESIKGKVRITIFFSPNNPLEQDVHSLLTEYQYASKGKIDVEDIDPTRSLSRAKEVLDKYKLVSNESLVVVDYEGRNKTVKASEMADVDQGNPMFGEGPKVTAFKGEQAITSAMIDLVEGKKNILGYLVGHKEAPIAEAPPPSPLAPPPDESQASPISVLKGLLENENIKLQELNLSEIDAIPGEIKTLLIAGPQYDFSDREMKLLRDFWEKKGRVLLLLDPAAKTPRLQAFLNELGVRVNDDRLMGLHRTGIQEISILLDVAAKFSDTPITKRLAGAQAWFQGGTSSLSLEPERVKPANVSLQALAQAVKGYWPEKDYAAQDSEKFQADALAYNGPPPTIAASVEKGASGDDRVQVNSSRMVVVSNATFVQDNALTQGQQALDFVSGSVNWLMSREQLIGIAPKVPKPLTFSLDDKALASLRLLVLVLMPLIPAVMGFAVWWQRRT